MTNRIRICRATVTPRGFCSECKGSQKEEGINQNFCPGNNEAAPRDGQDEPWTENTILLDGNGAPTGEWTQSFVDLAGRGSVVKSANGGESVAEYNNLGQLVKTTDADGVSSLFGYDGRGQQTVTALDVDGNGQIGYGTSTVTYYATDEVASTTTPAPGGGGGAQTTSIVYDAAGRQDIVTLPDGGQVDYDYYPTGSLQKVSGTRTYTVQYAYDAQGRLTTQTTNPGAAEQQTTTWAYEPGTGARGDWRIKPCRAARRPATLTPRAGAPPHGPTPGAS